MVDQSFFESYVAPISSLLLDGNVVEIAINPDGKIWCEYQGRHHLVEWRDHTYTIEQNRNLAAAIASEIKGTLSSKKPSLSGKIAYKDRAIRAQVIGEPAVEGGAAIALRFFNDLKRPLSEIGLLHGSLVDLEKEKAKQASRVRELVDGGDIHEAMKLCVEQRLNIVVSGGTSSGKTTFARSLLELVDDAERLITIEDAFELFPEHKNCVALKSVREEMSEMSPAKLLAATLRMRPDRIILGELRGNESLTFLEAINTGHGGSITTLHADSAKKAIERLAFMVMNTGVNMSYSEVKGYCESSIDLIIQLGRSKAGRGLSEIFMP